MSTNVIITPVAAATGVSAVGILPLVVAVGAVWAVSRALEATDAEYAALVEKSREDLRRERLATIQLHTTDLDRLVRSAGEARFRMTPLAAGSVRLRTGPRETLWAVRTPDGISLVGHEQTLRRLAVANTTSRAVEHLRARGYRVTTAQQPSGEIRISAAGRGREAVHVVVGGSGEATVDPQHFAGRACEGVVHDLAAAIDGTVVSFCPKPEYWTAVPVKVGGVTRG
jgi:hypothetical protein